MDRYAELSHLLIMCGSGSLPEHSVAVPPPPRQNRSMVEGWRGEVVCHRRMMTVRPSRVDPSLANWFALALAVRGNGISDFDL